MGSLPHPSPKVGIIRSVEVDITNELEQQKGSLKEEGRSARHWAKKAEDCAKQIEERDGGWGEGVGGG